MEANRTPNGGPPTADHNLVATYATVKEAREALTALERKGVEAGNISLLGEGMETSAAPETNVEQRSADMATTGAIGKRSAAGAVMGALIGAVVGALGGWALFEFADVGPSMPAVVGGAAVAAALFGAFAGVFYGGATGLPVSEEWGDTYESVKGGQTCVAVHSADADEVDRAAEVIEGTDPIEVVRFGRDGKRRKVA